MQGLPDVSSQEARFLSSTSVNGVMNKVEWHVFLVKNTEKCPWTILRNFAYITLFDTW